MSRWLVWAPLALLAILAGLFGLYGLNHDPHVIPDAMVGKPVPAVVLTRLDTGVKAPLKGELKGVTLVNLFASWCAPCAEENSALLALKAQGVRIVGIAYKDKPAAARAFLNRLGDPFATVLTDEDGAAGVEFGVSGVPETFVVDETGKVLAKHSGPLTPETADQLLAAARL